MLNIAIYRCCEASLTSVWHFQHVQISTATNIPEVKGVLAYSVYHLKAPSVASCHSSGTFAHCIEAISQTTQSFCSTKPSINQKQFSLSPALRAPKITSQPTWFQAVDWKSRRVGFYLFSVLASTVPLSQLLARSFHWSFYWALLAPNKGGWYPIQNQISTPLSQHLNLDPVLVLGYPWHSKASLYRDHHVR